MKKKELDYKKRKRYSLVQSFSFALQGISFALRWERNLRIHLCMVAYVCYFSLRYYHFTKGEATVLILSMAVVLTSELFNTAIEKSIDIVSPDYNPLAKIAKDVAAGAVFIAAIASFFIGIVLFWDSEILTIIGADIVRHLYIWIPLLIVTLCIIFLPEKSKEENL